MPLPFDPGDQPPDAGLVFIGYVTSPWKDRADCPKNMAAAREKGEPATIVLAQPYRAGLDGLERFSHVVVVTWLDRARRDLIVQKPRHAETARGTFALRSPVRPNPVGLHVARIIEIVPAEGRIVLEGIDVLDATPVIDLKPYFRSTDCVPDARDGR